MKTPAALKACIFKMFARPRGQHPEYKVNCNQPGCGDKRSRLGINVVKEIAHCFNCGFSVGGEALRKFLGYEGETYSPNDFETLDGLLSGTEEETEEQTPSASALEAMPMIEIPESEYYDLFAKDFARACVYLEDRGFDPLSLARQYGLMLPLPDDDRLAGRLIIPTFENGSTVYYQGRSLYGRNPKYINPSTVECPEGKSHFVFNLDAYDALKPMIVCEGVFSAMAAGPDAVAVFGKEISDVQARKILSKGPDQIIILFDPGTEHEAAHAVGKLGGKVEVFVARLENGDPNEVSREELQQVLSNAEPFENFFVQYPCALAGNGRKISCELRKFP